MRPAADVLAQARRAGGLRHVSTEIVDMGGYPAVATRWTFTDPWAAARMLQEGADDDVSDPMVRAWALEILAAVRAEYGETGPRISPEVADAFAEAIHANVQSAIAFVHERKETFQSARETMHRGAGDCDDHARLVYALAGAGGLPAALVFFTVLEDGRPVPAHVVAQIDTSAGPTWAETTLPADFGEDPLDAYERTKDTLDAANNPMAQPSGPGPMLSAPMGFLGLDVVSAQDVRDRIGELAALVTSIDSDVVACAQAAGSKLSTAKLDAWNQFVAEFRSFAADDPSFWNAGGKGRQTDDYAQRIRAWQLDLQETGCTMSTPVLPGEKDEPIVGVAKMVAIAAGCIAGAVVVYEAAQFLPRRRAA